MKFLFILFIIFTLLTGCSDKKAPNNTQPKNPKPISTDTETTRYSENEKAKYIANNILKNPDVRRVVVVVTGKTALVGIDGDTSKNSASVYKSYAVQRVKEVDPNISKVEVTTDKAMYNRISKLNDDIINGKPLSGIAEEFMNLIKKR